MSAVTPSAGAPGAAQAAVWALALAPVPAGATVAAAGVPAVVPTALVVVWAAAMAAAPGAAAAVAAEVADAAPAAAPLVRAARFSCCPATGPPWSEAGAARGHGGQDLGLGGAGLRRGTERVKGVAMPSGANLSSVRDARKGLRALARWPACCRL